MNRRQFIPLLLAIATGLVSATVWADKHKHHAYDYNTWQDNTTDDFYKQHKHKDKHKDKHTTWSNATINQPLSTTGRLLASNCFQCHGTNGIGGFDRITGGKANKVFKFQRKLAATDIMAAHAHGYSTAQLQAIISYLNQIR